MLRPKHWNCIMISDLKFEQVVACYFLFTNVVLYFCLGFKIFIFQRQMKYTIHISPLKITTVKIILF